MREVVIIDGARSANTRITRQKVGSATKERTKS